MMILPKPRKIIPTDGAFLVPSLWKIALIENDNLSNVVLDILFDWQKASLSEANLILGISRTILPIEGYRLSISPTKIIVEGADRLGVLHGLATLKQLDCHPTIDCQIIFDDPELPVRGFLLDISRDMIPTLRSLKQLVRWLWLCKMNHLELYVEGFSLELPLFPDLNVDHPLTMAEYLELEKYAEVFGVDLVPNMNTLGHMTEWLKLDKYRHLAECESGYLLFGYPFPPSTLNPTDPESSRLVKQMITPLVEKSKSGFFHLNADEPFELSQGKSKAVCEKKGLGCVYLDFLLPLFDWVQAHGKQPIIWGDVLANHPEVLSRFPQSVIVTDWGYDYDHDFETPVARYQAHHIPFLTAPGTSSWNSFASRRHDMLLSTVHAVKAAKNHDGLGILMTDWGDFSHPQPFIVSLHGLVFAAACSWRECDETNDFSDWMDQYIFIEEEKKGIAEILKNLANYSLLEPVLMSNQTLLFASWMYVDNDPTHPLALKAQVWKDALTKHPLYPPYSTQIQTLITDTRAQLSGRSSLVSKEINAVLNLMELSLILNEMVNQAIDRREQANTLIQELLLDSDTLWLHRNKPHGLAKATYRLKVLSEFLQNRDLI
ncbi:MAG: family 20 glycosylhydrolase [Candidatus Izemoplasmatales bacterium]|jgi:hypothetical protein|nr:family 20 glycosylhydrolase [Candidatus Izemoplasmatales bacterium]MDD4987779.1 family 20 glycosylhydrolase [Candidatus Izemoplasmatales bacterium]MDD5602153.1 family 20 glycosylhydrolase [Candidatus Izemoplasmatales bacterium]MDY0373287.1 family 20 glycosylhydrolase [Candidatus Izemoplasmatales bacterium]